jgi:hypothetical protein
MNCQIYYKTGVKDSINIADGGFREKGSIFTEKSES